MIFTHALSDHWYVVCIAKNQKRKSLPVLLGVLGQICQCRIEIHEARGFVHDSPSCQSARPAENTRNPDPPLPAPHCLPT